MEKSSGGSYNIVNDYKINLLSSSKIKQALLYIGINISTMKTKKQKYKVQGLKENQSIILGNDVFDINLLEIISDGEYEIDWSGVSKGSPCIMCGFIGECNITMEVVPYYPNALVFDGVDDYGINEDMSILTDYTVIAKRRWFRTDENDQVFIGKVGDGSGAFLIEGLIAGQTDFHSFGKSTRNAVPKEYYKETQIIYSTKNRYNSIIELSVGSESDNNGIAIGSRAYITPNRCWQGAFYSAYLFDRSLDEQEIKAFIRKYIDPEYLLPSEIPTPD